MAQSHSTSSKKVPVRSENVIKRNEEGLERAMLTFTTTQHSLN